MADQNNGKKSVGRGAGFLKMIQELSANPQPPERTQPTESTVCNVPETRQSQNVGRGRALLLEAYKSSQKQSMTPPEQPKLFSPSTSGGSGGAGRAKLLSMVTQSLETSRGQLAAGESSIGSSTSRASSSMLEKMLDLSVHEKSSSSRLEPISRQGESGIKVPLTANYINLKVDPGKGMFQYEVKFSPDIDSRVLRRRLLNQHTDTIGPTRTFDGVLLHLPEKLPQQSTVLRSDHPVDGSPVTLTLIYKKEQPMHENIQFFNVLLNRIMKALEMVRIGRDNFNPRLSTSVPQHGLEVWPGYVTAVNEYEGGLKLCIDTKHRVLRTDTIRDLMTVTHRRRPRDFRKAVSDELLGLSVLTRYNNKTYRIDDIDWDKNPTFKFKKGDSTISLIQYYQQHWSLTVEDNQQPLLVHREKKRTPTGETYEDLILLVPELCYAAGLTDSIRSDFRVMKDLDAVTKIGPSIRREEIEKLVAQIQKNETTRNILAEWGLQLEDRTVSITGRALNPETINFGQNRSTDAGPNADWSRFAVNNPVLTTPHLKNWFVIYCQKDSTCAKDFIDMMKNVCKTMAMNVNNPQVVTLRDDRTESYINELRKCIESTVQIVVTIVTSNRGDRYAAIKKLCCVEMPIASQVIVSRTISNAQKLRSVTQKIALQINCKLGGSLWSLKMPFGNCMVCGIDVYHAGLQQGIRGSVAGFVASLDKLASTWYSKVCLQSPHQELIDLLQGCLVSAIKAYYKKNHRYPDHIILYRDGVGDGQLETVVRYEVKQLLATFVHIDPSYKPMLTIVIVQKRINTRIFLKTGEHGLDNPAPGTIIDTSVTKRNYYDFFLISQHVRQGTVSPTHYIVIYDGANMKTDHIQRFTYKLCHLYYNWPGTIRVPAPCQYAHKLAYLVGQSIKMEPNDLLSNTLYFL